ncbi:MAG: nitrous oxide reductase accessory protein NosL [Chitinophagaceae bacterium]|nr:nitrous oxide reductase accessory protein NosL [Chitinophagaceae bacterium]MDP1763463.1 nitrous oxide reductase accessory protein NosL [Sediminibacterium sp.]MDP1811901.1 nitrous oxide reductase accessory protein NosL [Sediminibacterium sp.]MDP3128466.1 nitrous oxide reductase accessory protein NosL [Sediminibacterium sp.]
MNTNRLTITSRILLFLCGIGLIAILFVPMWRIELDAPQYPEGLMLLIYANKLGGNVDIINGLNHYIGMKTLHDKDFVEFTVLPGIIIFFSVAFVLTALVGKRKIMNILFFLFISFGVIAMIDFWKWEYQYGHDLNPDAAIKIPGMAYQPPLIGFKQLLNFGAYSVPDIGGWIFIVAGAVLLLLVIVERKNHIRLHTIRKVANLLLVFVFIGLISSCSTGPDKIKFGKDNCYFCKMTISDNRFGAELVTKKGKVYKFDDGQCMLSFLSAQVLTNNEISNIYFIDFNGEHSLINVQKAFLLKSELFKSPMGGNIAAFSVQDSMREKAIQYKAIAVSWDQLNK